MRYHLYMNKVFGFLSVLLAACGGAAGVEILDSAPDPVTSPAAKTAEDAAVPAPKAAAIAPIPESGADAAVVPEASVDAGSDANVAAADAGVDAAPDADAAEPPPPPPPPPPVCQVNGSCKFSAFICDEYEATGAALANLKASCNGASVWSDTPCSRVNTVGSCNADIGVADADCPKFYRVYTSPATVAQSMNNCAAAGGTFVP